MPKSRVRKQATYTPPPTRSAKNIPGKPWVGPVMGICFLIGIAWLVVYYLTNGEFPAPIQAGNLLVGFAFLVLGFVFATQWR